MRIGFWGEDPSQSFFLQVYFPSVWADGEEVFREGYPMALKDPEVLQLAEALGGTELLVVQCTVLPGTFPEPRAIPAAVANTPLSWSPRITSPPSSCTGAAFVVSTGAPGDCLGPA